MNIDALKVNDEDSYADAFLRLYEHPSGGDGWLREIRVSAMERFRKMGFPTPRHEDWRFTNISQLKSTPFLLASFPESLPSARAVGRALLPGLGGVALVFVNGYHAPGVYPVDSQPEGVVAISLKEAVQRFPELVREHLARYADQGDAFTALNAAFMGDGAFVYVPKGVVVEKPIYVAYLSISSDAPLVSFPRSLILLGEGAQAEVVEDYVSVGGGVHFTCAVTEVVAEEGSVFHHYMLERENVESFNVSTLRVEQKRSSAVSSHSALIGGALVRNNVHPVLAGEGADCLINGIFMGRGTQHLDNFMRVEHASPHSGSRQFYYGILDDSSHGVFSGRIIVHKGAQKTDAKQTNRNILLSDAATIDTKPQLEIYADDVKCTHGATIGQIDSDALFYLRSRGIPGDEARAMLLTAFAGEGLERMGAAPVRRYLERFVSDWFARARGARAEA
ncbi:MAG: Fe-S cluster assembly protein SufD [Candidatus Methanosuratincola sp.]|jgi:Fe-S cluster assembly protein SufD